MAFLPPAAFAWLDVILFYIGISQVGASLPAMIRGLVPSIAGYMSYLFFDRHFSFLKILSMAITIAGVIVVCFTQLYFEIQEGTFKATGFGILALVASAFTQATQHILEERTFRKDQDLTVVDMDVMVVFWKNIFMWVTIPIFAAIPSNISSSGVVENNIDAIYEVMNSPTLLAFVILAMVTFAANAFLSLYIINQGNTMQKVMVALLKTFVVWIFFMIWPKEGHENFSWIKLIGMGLITIGTYFYMKLDTEEFYDESNSEEVQLSFTSTQILVKSEP